MFNFAKVLNFKKFKFFDLIFQKKNINKNKKLTKKKYHKSTQANIIFLLLLKHKKVPKPINGFYFLIYKKNFNKDF